MRSELNQQGHLNNSVLFVTTCSRVYLSEQVHVIGSVPGATCAAACNQEFYIMCFCLKQRTDQYVLRASLRLFSCSRLVYTVYSTRSRLPRIPGLQLHVD